VAHTNAVLKANHRVAMCVQNKFCQRLLTSAAYPRKKTNDPHACNSSCVLHATNYRQEANLCGKSSSTPLVINKKKQQHWQESRVLQFATLKQGCARKQAEVAAHSAACLTTIT
jgi:hypothetical protein